MSSPGRGVRVLPFLASGLLLAGVALMVEPARVREALVQVSPGVLALVLLPVPLLILLRTAKWVLLGRLAWPGLGPGAATRSVLLSVAAGLVTPGRIGELARVIPFPAERRVAAGLMYMVDRVVDLAAALAVLLAGVLLADSLPGGLEVGPAAGATLAAVLLLLVALSRPRIREAVAGRLGRARRFMDAVAHVSLGTLAAACALSVAALLAYVAQSWLLFRAMADVPPGTLLVIVPAVLVTNVVPLTVGGLGIRESAGGALFALFGHEAAAGVVGFFLLFLANSVLPGLAGALLLPGGPEPGAAELPPEAS